MAAQPCDGETGAPTLATHHHVVCIRNFCFKLKFSTLVVTLIYQKNTKQNKKSFKLKKKKKETKANTMLGYGKHRGVRVHKRTRGPLSGYQTLPDPAQTLLHYACLLLAPPWPDALLLLDWLLFLGLQNPDVGSPLSPGPTYSAPQRPARPLITLDAAVWSPVCCWSPHKNVSSME